MSKTDYRIALGAVSNDESLAAALYIDEVGSGLQPNTFWGIRSYNCYAVVFHPVKQGVVYVTIQPRGTMNGIWRSDDFGKSWTHLTHGMPAPETCGRVDVTDEGGFTNSFTSRKSEVKINFSGPGTRRWQVWALLPQSARSPGSGVRTFRYLV
jgi:hypothetical protein